MTQRARTRGSSFPSLLALSTVTILLSLPLPASALFHFSVIGEVMTSYQDDPNVQFVEIRMLFSSQNLVANSVLGAFDANGSYMGDVLIVPGNVSISGANVTWLMATSRFQAISGLTPDFIMPAGLPSDGGMLCWGAPGSIVPNPASWDHANPLLYVDCLAYGSYSGPSNASIGTPTEFDADGHSLLRVSNTNTHNNAIDFACADPATPRNNTAITVNLDATISCTCGNGVTERAEDCDDGDRLDGDGCSADCFSEVCGDVNVDDLVNPGDIDTYRVHLADPNGMPLTASGAERCTVIGPEPVCDIRQLSVLRRALAIPFLPPGIAPVCEAVLPPG